MTAHVIPFPGSEVETPQAPRRPPVRENPCPVCLYRVGSDDYEYWTCDGCQILLHGPCYWGRVAPLDEWLEWLRLVHETDLDVMGSVLCAACRQLEGLGKEGA